MGIRNIIKINDKMLRTTSKEVSNFDEKLHKLLDDMKETMILSGGVGLAGVQVGVLSRVFIVSFDDKYYEFINPKIKFASKKLTMDYEGCLSIPSIKGTVPRSACIEIEAYDRNGLPFVLRAEKYLARIICHENDHLDGILFIDKMIDNKFSD